jgi:hypothetical protein
LEIQLGNIRPGMGKAGDDDWKSQKLEQLLTKVEGDDEDLRNAEASVEAIFRKVAKGLTDEGFAPPAIAAIVNARVAPEMKLPYCNAAEVQEALRIR